MSGAGPLTESADARTTADLSVSDRQYFGHEFDAIDAYPTVGMDPDAPGQIIRHSYIFQAQYTIGSDEYGGIQLRARIHTRDAELPDDLAEWLKRSAHRAAYLFDTSIETNRYGPAGSGTRGTAPGDGYLSGFNPTATYQNWESQAVTESEIDTAPGVIDWSTEIYTDDNFNFADLSGIAQGVCSPYRLTTDEQDGRDSVDVPPHSWNVTKRNDGRYQISPPGRTQAADRYRDGAGNGKLVVVNGRPVGRLGERARVFLTDEYSRGDPNQSARSGQYSRVGLVDETAATYQAIRDGGNLYAVGETEDRINLRTAGALPPGYEPADADSVPVDLEARAGSPGYTWRSLELRDPDADAVRVECRRDDQLIKHLGLSDPTYEHPLGPRQEWYV
jgi:hypothetical protein